jgi:hypothetical protein
MDRVSSLLRDRRVVLAAGAVLALLLGLALAFGISPHRRTALAPPPASQGGLVVETGKIDDSQLDPARPLRCFVSGQFVGEVTLAECARKNGVATGSLDVGVDSNGQLAAADQAGTTLTPLPPAEAGPASAPVISAPPATVNPAGSDPHVAPASPTGPCWRYANSSWERIGEAQQGACVATLYNGVCQRSGAAYGRWGEMTLRLVRGKIEISSDNRNFHTLLEQGPGCSIPPG